MAKVTWSRNTQHNFQFVLVSTDFTSLEKFLQKVLWATGQLNYAVTMGRMAAVRIENGLQTTCRVTLQSSTADINTATEIARRVRDGNTKA